MATRRQKQAAVAATVGLLVIFEGCRTYAYRDPVGIPTVCFGHTNNVHMGDRYTKAGCKKLLIKDLPRYQAMVDRCIHVSVPDQTYAALTSFTYNVGGGALCRSSVARLINEGDRIEGCEAMNRYVYAHGFRLPGLVRRRAAESNLCKEG